MMPRLRNTFDRLLAALMFFTRLPLWRIYRVPSESFSHAADYWPFAGWITGGALACSYALFVQFFPIPIALILALLIRILVTGALHEDGLADCCDGFGGGTSRARILEIMKDSHIGTFGVVGLIFYFLLLIYVLESIASIAGPVSVMALTLFTADVWGKSVASLLTSQLEYARKQSEAKSGVVYLPRRMAVHVVRILLSVVPVALLWMFNSVLPHPVVFLAPILVELLWAFYLKHRIQGYTGDCCGAAFLLCELSMLLAFLIFGYC